MPTTHEYSLFSAHVYGSPNAAGESVNTGTGRTEVAGWELLRDSDIIGAMANLVGNEIPFKQFWADHSFAATAYEKNGQIVIAFRGTEPSDLEDWVANAGLFIGELTHQYLFAYFFTNAVKEYAASKGITDITFTGHSLGGALASIIAAREDKHAVVFNSALAKSAVEDAFDGEIFESLESRYSQQLGTISDSIHVTHLLDLYPGTVYN